MRVRGDSGWLVELVVLCAGNFGICTRGFVVWFGRGVWQRISVLCRQSPNEYETEWCSKIRLVCFRYAKLFLWGGEIKIKLFVLRFDRRYFTLMRSWLNGLYNLWGTSPWKTTYMKFFFFFFSGWIEFKIYPYPSVIKHRILDELS